MKRLKSVVAGLALSLVGAVHAADLPDLRVEYRAWSIGADGARQELSYAERLVRRGDRLWIEREIPAAAQRRHEQHAHGGLGHRHADVAGAPLWIERDARGALKVKLVDRHERRLIEIGEPNYGNVGFGGRWDLAYHLLDPADLQRLTAVGSPRSGIQRYELRHGAQNLVVDWVIDGRYAREIRSEDAQGLSGRLIRARVLPPMAVLPWNTVDGYAARDYSDLLD